MKDIVHSIIKKAIAKPIFKVISETATKWELMLMSWAAMYAMH